ncbi:hypothetical protein RJ640_000526 [Escallonia rubra]|uniref:Uncharacterized protein n=1 Tax=Escallonia rubra TaxID=112253 RepID=A0AA88U2T1_9ASTE|nr:hypothetical protein RJ640_000526 [Escallonia rubra]
MLTASKCNSDGAFSTKPHGIHSMVVTNDNFEVMKECQSKFFVKSYSPAGDLSNGGISTYAYSGLARKNNSEVPTLVKETDPGDQGKDRGTRGNMVPEKTGSSDVNNFESFANLSSVENSKEVANVETSIGSAALEKGTEGNKSSLRDTTTKDKSLSSNESASSDSGRESSFISVSPLGMAPLTNLDAKSVAPMMSAELNTSSVPKAATSKVVLKLEFHHEKSKQKATQKVSNLSDFSNSERELCMKFATVESIAMDPKDKKLTVTGHRSRNCHPEIVSVGPAQDPEKEEEEPKKEEAKKPEEKKKDTKEEVKFFPPYYRQPPYYHMLVLFPNPKA